MEFVLLFTSFLIAGIALIYSGLTFQINFLTNTAMLALGGIALAIDAFALLVQAVNWKYYKK
ncbi:MAG: hypothetical protein WC308_00030 [archaeon]|jgi:hypothetical protein